MCISFKKIKFLPPALHQPRTSSAPAPHQLRTSSAPAPHQLRTSPSSATAPQQLHQSPKPALLQILIRLTIHVSALKKAIVISLVAPWKSSYRNTHIMLALFRPITTLHTESLAYCIYQYSSEL